MCGVIRIPHLCGVLQMWPDKGQMMFQGIRVRQGIKVPEDYASMLCGMFCNPFNVCRSAEVIGQPNSKILVVYIIVYSRLALFMDSTIIIEWPVVQT